jgi:integrase
VDRKKPAVLTPTEQEAIGAQPNPRNLPGRRNQITLRLMLDTGLRAVQGDAPPVERHRPQQR